MIWYIIIGTAWTAWLEYYTSKYFDLEDEGKKWSTRERIFQVLLWPLNVIIFVITFLKGLGDNE